MPKQKQVEQEPKVTGRFCKKPVVVDAMRVKEIVYLAFTAGPGGMPEWLVQAMSGDANRLRTTSPGDPVKVWTKQGRWVRAGWDEWILHAAADDLWPVASDVFEATYEPALSSAQEGGEGHRVEITFDGLSLGPVLRLIHPETGCDPGEDGRPGTCWLDGWLEDGDEPWNMLRGKLTVPATYELDGDQPVFHLQPPATLSDVQEGQGEHPLGIDNGGLTRAILDALDLPADEDYSSWAQANIQGAIQGWFYTTCWNCKRRVLADAADKWDERPCPDNGEYECHWCPDCVAKEASADA